MGDYHSTSNRDSQDSHSYDSGFEHDLNEAIQLSLQDYRNDTCSHSQNTGSTYVNFNTDGTYFISDAVPKGPNDLFNPNHILENLFMLFKIRGKVTNGSESSSSKFPGSQSWSSETEHTEASLYYAIGRDHLNDILNTLFGKDQYRSVENYEIESWCHHGFANHSEGILFWGLLQSRSGPCGVLASVQSYMIRSILFNYSFYGELSFMLQNKSAEEVLMALNDMFFNYISMKIPEFPRGDCINLHPFLEFLYTIPLVESLCNILYNVAPKSVYNIILYDKLKDNYDPFDSLLLESTYTYRTFDNINSVANYLFNNLDKVTGKLGVISFVVSVVCTRTLEKVKDDMDDPSHPLIGPYGHCSQELVNLLLHGRAVSNVFNGDKVIDDNSSASLTLKGIGFQNTLGFLTDLEAMRLYKVGSFYKNPLVPIWVISSHNHYSVLFGLDGSACSLSQSDMIEQNLTEAWSKIDTQDNKYIEVNSLGSLLGMLGIRNLLRDAMNSIEIVSGLVLWTNMLAWYSSVVAERTQTKSGVSNTLTLFHYDGNEKKTPLHKVTVENDHVFVADPFNGVDANIVGTVDDSYTNIGRIVWTRWPRTSVKCSVVPTD
ncbi:conserved hypothetical protein [Theileria orientalis strain Shintoku]|uniref:Deubiquitinating enzyme MINDY-3/4 conserved domain-containing protein n=1 Tax=Theileria orientalis strain Shintoku TaxID=869250 RepID=J4C913_THEOR|nr:conserved hypothetical protein [Theileria orientalis strain Shintoku]BAM41738.1 conserved hypothetical protein [Theileria orientalis strain Shintoku]|eukprot:XP_009692039.1 conserved hypothetical protein [Theileria orientalis strain Shintoku]